MIRVEEITPSDNLFDPANNEKVWICYNFVNKVWNIICQLMNVKQDIMTEPNFLVLQCLHVRSLFTISGDKNWLMFKWTER